MAAVREDRSSLLKMLLTTMMKFSWWAMQNIRRQIWRNYDRQREIISNHRSGVKSANFSCRLPPCVVFGENREAFARA
jgi:hypothetical protein